MERLLFDWSFYSRIHISIMHVSSYESLKDVYILRCKPRDDTSEVKAPLHLFFLTKELHDDYLRNPFGPRTNKIKIPS